MHLGPDNKVLDIERSRQDRPLPMHTFQNEKTNPQIDITSAVILVAHSGILSESTEFMHCTVILLV